MARPATTSCRPALLAASATARMRATLEAKMVTTTRRLAPVMSPASERATSRSDGERPSRKRIGGIAHHRRHALVAERARRATSVGGADQRVHLELPVAGVQHEAERRADASALRLRDRVRQRDELDIEAVRRRSGCPARPP